MNNLDLDKLFSTYNAIESFDLDKNKQYTFSIMLDEDPEILTNISDDTDAMKKQIYSYYPKLAEYTIKNINSAFYMHDAWYVFEIYPKLSYIELKNILGEHDYGYFILD